MSTRQKKRILISILIFAFFSIQIYSQTANSEATDQEELELILKKSAEYCEKLSNLALFFVCEERIVETQFADWSELRKGFSLPRSGITIKQTPKYEVRFGMTPWAREVNRFVYGYQLIRKGKKFQESRILLSGNKEERNEKDAQLKTKRFKHTQVVLAPVALLSKSNQQYYDYKIIGREHRSVPEEIIIEVTPKSDIERKGVYGKIWISKADYSILKMEWEQESFGNMDWIKAQAELFEAVPEVISYVEFNFYKDGIRFPSKLSITENYIRNNKKLFQRSSTTVSYRDYKFFTVDTDHIIKKGDIPSFYAFEVDKCNFESLVLRIP